MTVDSLDTPAQTTEGGLTPKKSSLLRSSMIMASGTLVSRILGFIRAALLVAAIGSVGGGVMAAFQTANTLPNMVFNILAAGVLDAVLVPQIVRALRKKDGDVFVNRLLTAAGLILFILTVVAMIAAPLLIFVTAASYSAEIRALAIAFSLVCLPQIFFYGLYNLIGEVLNARGVFGPYMWAPVVNNIVGIAGLGIFLGMWGSHPEILPIGDFTSAQFWVLAGSSTLGVICQALVLFIPLRHAGVTLRVDFHFRQTNFGTISRVAGWTFATLGVSQIGIFSSSNLVAAADAWAHQHQPTLDAVANASEVVVGNAAYATSFMIFMVPQSLIAVSLATAVFTRLTAAAAIEDHREVAAQFAIGVRSISTLTLLAAAILTAGAIPMMQMVLPKANTLIVESYAWVLTAMLPGVASIGLILMAQRVYFAYEDAKPTFYMGIIPNILQVIVGWTFYFVFSPLWWVVGAACAEAVCRTSQGFIGLFMVRKANEFIEPRPLVVGFLRTYGAAVASTFVGYGAMMVMGWHTSAESALGKIVVSLGRLSVVAIVVTIAFWLVMRLISPTETYLAGQLIANRIPLPSPIRRFIIGEKPVSDAVEADNGDSESGDSELEGTTSMHDLPRGGMSHHEDDAVESVSIPSEDTGADPSIPLIDPTGNSSAVSTHENDSDISDSPDTPSQQADSDTFNEDNADSVSFTQRISNALAPAIAATTASVNTLQARFTSAMTTLKAKMATSEKSGDDDHLPEVSSVSDAWDTDDHSPTRVSHTHYASTDNETHHDSGLTSNTSVLNPNDEDLPFTDHAAVISDVPHTVKRRSFRGEFIPHPLTTSEASTSYNGPQEPTAHPTKAALIFFAAFTAASFAFAVHTALSPINTELPTVDTFSGAQTQDSQSESQSADEVPMNAPKITSVSVLSWRDDQGDNENHAINMIDGNAETEWHSRQFEDGFGDDTGITIVVKLDRPVPLNQVSLTMHESTTGGEIFLLAPNEKPRAGQVLASGAMSPQTVLKPAQPVEVDSFALRFGSVPTSVDGALWAWIYEIHVQ